MNEADKERHGRKTSGRVPGSRRKTALRLAWMGLYALSVRAALVLVTALLFVYFGINSPTVASHASDVISDLLPGNISFKQLHWGPSPGHLEVMDLRISDPHGQPVISAQWAQIELQWWAMLERTLRDEPGLEIWLTEVRLSEPRVNIGTNKQGKLGVVEAFVDSEAPETNKKSAPFSLRLDRGSVERGSVVLNFPGFALDVQDLDFDVRYHLKTAPGAELEMGWEARDILTTETKMTLPALDESGLAQFPQGSITARRAEGDLWSVKVHGLTADLGATKLHHGDADVSWRELTKVLARNLDVQTSTSDPFLASMLKAPLFNAKASARGRVSWQTGNRLDGRFEVKGGGIVSGFDLPEIEGKVTVRMGHSELINVAVHTRDLIAHGYGGTLRAPKLDYLLQMDGLQLVRGRVLSEGISPAEILATDIVGMKGASALAAAGRLDGAFDMKLRMKLGSEERPGLKLDVNLDTDLRLKRADKALFLPKALPQLFAKGGVLFSMSPDRPMWVELDQFALSTAQDKKKDRPSQSTNAQWIYADGRLAFEGESTHLKVEANVPKLARLLAPLGVEGVDGSVMLRHVAIQGATTQPTVGGSVHLKNLNALGYSLNDLHFDLSLRRGIVSLNRLRALSPYGQLRGDFKAHLFGRSLNEMARSQPISGRNVSLRNLKLDLLSRRFGLRGYRGLLTLHEARFDLNLQDPMNTLIFQGRFDLRDAQVLRQSLRRVQAQVSLRDGQVRVRDLEVELPALPGEMTGQRGGPVIAGEVDYDLQRQRYRTELSFPAIDFSQIGDLAYLKLPLYGSLAGTLRAQGDLRKIALKADISVAGLAWDKIKIGDARLLLDKSREGTLSIKSSRFFKGFELIDGSEVHFHRLIPDHMRLGVRARELDPFATMGMEGPSGMKVQIDAVSWTKVDLRRGHELYGVSIGLPTAGAVVELGHGLSPLSNTHPVVIKVHPDRVDIGSTYLAIGRDELELCGTLYYPDTERELKTRMSLFMAGTLDVLRTGALTNSMAALDMRVDIGKDPAVLRDPAAACLDSLKRGRGALRVSGDLDNLTPRGLLELQRSTLTPRGFGQEIVLSEGGQLVVRRNQAGRLTVTIPEDNPIEALLDDGSLQTWGMAEIADNALRTLDLRLTANDVSYLQPKMMSLTTSGGLRVEGVHLDDPQRRDILLRGDINLSEAAYFANHDRVGKIATGLASRQGSSGASDLLKEWAWLGPTRLNVALRGQNIEVLSHLTMARTDVDLRANVHVGGTVAAPELKGRVDIEPGSVVTYTLVKRDFEVSRGSLDLDGDWREGYVDITARTLIEMDADTDTSTTSTMGIGLNRQASSASQDNNVTITMQARGKLGAKNLKDFDIRLSSTPPYEQGDIQAMILTGQPMTDGSGGGLGSRSTINLLVDDVAEAFTKAIFSGLFDKVEIAPTAAGGILAKVKKNIGKAIKLSGQYMSTSAGSETRASFSFRFQDHWSMEGMLRQTLTSSTGVTAGNVYEGKVRYRTVIGD